VAVIIKNISKEYNTKGKQKYSLRINETEFVQFAHNAEDGLAVCLLKAAEALIIKRKEVI